jgi:hypothetical protein
MLMMQVDQGPGPGWSWSFRLRDIIGAGEGLANSVLLRPPGAATMTRMRSTPASAAAVTRAWTVRSVRGKSGQSLSSPPVHVQADRCSSDHWAIERERLFLADHTRIVEMEAMKPRRARAPVRHPAPGMSVVAGPGRHTPVAKWTTLHKTGRVSRLISAAIDHRAISCRLRSPFHLGSDPRCWPSASSFIISSTTPSEDYS